MNSVDWMMERRALLGGMGAVLVAALGTGPLRAGVLSASGLKGILGNASDSALDKLAKPDAFYADTAIRILLPGAKGKLASKLLKSGDKLGLTTKLTKSLNDAAGLAAGEAKPVFRKAVDGISLSDVPDLALKNDGATQYLRKSSEADLVTRVRPLVSSALTKVGAFNQLSKLNLGKTASLLGLAGLTPDGLTDSVTNQALNGIFSYIGKEEASLRANPLDVGKSILGGIIK